MSSRTFLCVLCAASLLAALTGESAAQSTSLPWSAFSGGFGASAAGNTKGISSVGEMFVGIPGAGPGRTVSGFLANPLFHGVQGIPVSFQTGWNMVAVPARGPDPRKASLYQEATSNAFGFSNGYFSVDSLRVGRGYWLKYPATDAVTVWGIAAVAETVVVVQGWNLIGGISTPVAEAAVGSIPPGIVVSSFFKFDNPLGYSSSATVDPGRAYWVKTDQAGSLVFSSGTGTQSRVIVRPTGEMPPPPPEESVSEASVVPSEYALDEAYPNPFNPETEIRYALPEAAPVRLQVYSLVGGLVTTLVDREEGAGVHSVRWNASESPSGVYFVRIAAGGFRETRKVLLLR